jgi:hypothetical protein
MTDFTGGEDVEAGVCGGSKTGTDRVRLSRFDSHE